MPFAWTEKCRSSAAKSSEFGNRSGGCPGASTSRSRTLYGAPVTTTKVENTRPRLLVSQATVSGAPAAVKWAHNWACFRSLDSFSSFACSWLRSGRAPLQIASP